MPANKGIRKRLAKVEKALDNPNSSKYIKSFAKQAYRHCLLGATDKDLAELFNVSEVTIGTWKKTHPSFLRAVKDGKENADARVAEAMFKRSVGYEHPEDKVFCSNGEVTVVPTIKHYPPDGPTCLNWLKNRQPETWRDKRETKLDGSASFIQALSGAISGNSDR